MMQMFKIKSVKKTILTHKLLSSICILCLILIIFYYYCKYRTVKWLHETNFLVQATSVYPTFQGFKPSLKIAKLEIKNKNSNASVSKITAENIIIRPSMFSFVKLFSSYAFSFELNMVKINEHGKVYGEIVKGNG